MLDFFNLSCLLICIYILYNPFQVAEQASIECIALVMEPQSGLYTSPVIVLDFRSLYPSVMIANNMCYSTCLGKIPQQGGYIF